MKSQELLVEFAIDPGDAGGGVNSESLARLENQPNASAGDAGGGNSSPEGTLVVFRLAPPLELERETLVRDVPNHGRRQPRSRTGAGVATASGEESVVLLESPSEVVGAADVRSIGETVSSTPEYVNDVTGRETRRQTVHAVEDHASDFGIDCLFRTRLAFVGCRAFGHGWFIPLVPDELLSLLGTNVTDARRPEIRSYDVVGVIWCAAPDAIKPPVVRTSESFVRPSERRKWYDDEGFERVGKEA
jgi:hypothetical protein